MEKFEDFDLDTFNDIMEAYADFCVGELYPLNQASDHEGLKFDPSKPYASVTMPKGFKEAYQGFVENAT